jgi:TolB-like protein/Flp pilus assembly protein TadD
MSGYAAQLAARAALPETARRRQGGDWRMDFFAELGRRNVIRMAGLYLVGAWLVTQVCSTVLPMFGAPEWLPRSIVILLAIGFVPALVFSWVFELTPEGLKREVEVESHASIAPQTGRRMDRAIIVVLLLALGYFAFDKFVLAPRREATAVAAARIVAERKATVPAAVDDKSIAVIPLANGGGEGQQFFSDGLSEALIIALSQFDGLKVIGRNSSFQFRDTRDDSAAIGRKLGVAHLLEGSVQHAGDAVRVSVELIDAASGRTRWSQRYDRPYRDLFQLQDEITNAVAGALQAKLLSPNEAAEHSDRPPSGNIDAYSAYLQGMKHWHDQEFPEAAEYMTRAVQLDPGYAAAWAHLSGSWSTVAAFSNEASAAAREHMRISRHAADKALQLAPALGSAHAARAYLQFYEFDERGALAECRRAVQLAPDDGTVLNGCGYTLAGIGKLREAIALRERLLSIEPLYTVNDFQYARLLMATGRLDEAEKYLRTDKQVAWPYQLERLNLAVLRGDASAALEIARQSSPRDRNLYMALATQVGPDRAAADKWLAGMLADKTWIESFDVDGNDNPYKIAQVHALRGDADRALEWLERSLSMNPSRALFLLADPFLLRFRDDPRFIATCRKIGLSPPGESEALGIDQIRALVPPGDPP